MIMDDYDFVIEIPSIPDLPVHISAPLPAATDCDISSPLPDSVTKRDNFSPSLYSSYHYVIDHLDEYELVQLPDEIVQETLIFHKHTLPNGLDIFFLDIPYPLKGSHERFPLAIPAEITDTYDPMMDAWMTISMLLCKSSRHDCRFPAKRNLEFHYGEFQDSHLHPLAHQCYLSFCVRDWSYLETFLHQAFRQFTAECSAFVKPRLPSPSETVFLMNQSYGRVVDCPRALTKCKANHVYGETSTILVQNMLKNHLPNYVDGTVFVDLGSGLGNVVLQAAAQRGWDCYGIEQKDVPNGLAQRISIEFQARLASHCFSHGQINLFHGDFLTDPRISQIVSKASIIFANNFVYGPMINQKLVTKYFKDLADGTIIVSFSNFAPLKSYRRLSNYNAKEFSSILDIVEVPYPSGHVSWTSASGSYYIQTINRMRKEEWLKREEEEKARKSRTSSSNHPRSAHNFEIDIDEKYHGNENVDPCNTCSVDTCISDNQGICISDNNNNGKFLSHFWKATRNLFLGKNP